MLARPLSGLGAMATAIPAWGDPDYPVYHAWTQYQKDPTAPRISWPAFKADWCKKNPGKCIGGQVAGDVKVTTSAVVGGASAQEGAPAAKSTVLTPAEREAMRKAAEGLQTAAGGGVSQSGGTVVTGRTWANLVAEYAGRAGRYLPWIAGAAVVGLGVWWWRSRAAKERMP